MVDVLSKQEQSRYARHLSLPEVGREGQARLKKAKVLIVGVGGLGCPAALYLAAASIGTIGLVDHDKVDETNLQRQVLFSTDDIGKAKVLAAKEKLLALNPLITIHPFNEKLSSKNALELLKKYDIVIDGSDNIPTRYLINDACVMLGKPFVYGAVHQWTGHAAVFNYCHGPTYRDLFPKPAPEESIPNCAQAGVLGVVPGIIGMVQATEAIKTVLGQKNILSGRYLTYDALKMEFGEVRYKKNPDAPKITGLVDGEAYCTAMERGQNNEITAKELKSMIEGKGSSTLIDVREPEEQQGGMIQNAVPVSFTKIYKGNLDDFSRYRKDQKLVLYCHTGSRSAYVAEQLKRKGFTNVHNLIGGIDAWADEVKDPSLAY